jgi:YVTN family beta-propeller protein
MKNLHSLMKRYGKGSLVCLAAAVGAAVMLGSTCSVLNKAPTVPVISGPSAGVVGVPVTFKATATDPENDSIAFQFDWGDSSIGVWTNLIASGETASVAYTYSDSGTFSVKTKAKDRKGKESDWSAPVSCQLGIVQFSWPDSLIGEISLDANAEDRCLVTPDGRFLYVAHLDANFVTPVRLADHAVLPHVIVGPKPFCLAATPDAQWLYVTCVGDSSVAVVRTSDNTVTTRIRVGPIPKAIAASPDGQYVYVAVSDRKILVVIRTIDNTVEDTIPLGHEPFDVVTEPTGQSVYVSLIVDELLGVISIPQLALVDTVSTGLFSKWLALSPDGEVLFVSNHTDSGIAVVRTSDLTVSAHINVADEYVGDIAVASSGDHLLASYWGGIKCVALPAYAVVDTAPYGDRGALAFSADGESLYLVADRKVLVLGKRQ